MLHFNIYNMATFKVLLHSSNRRKDGTYPVSLRIIKNMKAKYISLGLYSKKEEWDVIGERFRCDKRVCPNYKEFNARIVQLLARAQEVERHFEFDRIDWTLNQFEDAFLYKDKKGKFLDFALLCIKDMKETGHIGNAKVWEKVICNMKLFDKKLSTRYFQEIDIKYVGERYNIFKKDIEGYKNHWELLNSSIKSGNVTHGKLEKEMNSKEEKQLVSSRWNDCSTMSIIHTPTEE